MALDINWYKALPKQEQTKEVERLESSHRDARKHFENVDRACKSVIADEKNSAKDIAEIIKHWNDVKIQLKDIEEDMAKISAYTYKYTYAGTTSSSLVGCDDRDPYVALNSILGNGVVQIRPGDLCQFVAAGTKTYQNILDDLQKEKEANERHIWIWHQNEYSRPTKQEEIEQKDQKEQRERDQREQKEQREKEQREQREQKEQKAKGAQ